MATTRCSNNVDSYMVKSMEGKNKKIEQEIPVSAWPTNSNDACLFNLMPPSNLPLAPSPFHVWHKPYFMNHVGAGASSSGTGTCLFEGSDPLSMKGENNKKTNQNPSDQNLTLATSAGDNSVNPEVGNGVQVRRGRKLDPNMDPRKLRRILSNRLSAQKARTKKLQHVCDMERKAESLETLIAVLTPQVALQRNKKYLLEMEQSNLNQQIAACANHKIIVEAEIEERRAEVNRLRQLFLTQQQQKIQAQRSWAGWEHGLPEQMMNPCLNQTMYANSNQVDAGENTAEINRLNQLNLRQQQEKSGQILMPGWEPGRGQLTNVGLDQSGPGQMQNYQLNLRQQQEKSGQILMPGWEPGRGQLTNVGLDQYGPGQMQSHQLNLRQQQEIPGQILMPGQGQLTNVGLDQSGQRQMQNHQLNLKLQQEKPRQILMPDWEPRRGQLTNVGLDQSGSGQLQNQILLNQLKQQQKGSFNSNLGGLEQILNINPENHHNPRNDFI